MDTTIIDGSEDDPKKRKPKRKKREQQKINPITLMPTNYNSKEWMLRNSNIGVGYSDPKLEKEEKKLRTMFTVDGIKKVVTVNADAILGAAVKMIFGDNVKYRNLFQMAQMESDVQFAEDRGKEIAAKVLGLSTVGFYHGVKTVFGLPPIKGVDDVAEFLLEEASTIKVDELADRTRKKAGAEFVDGDVKRIDGKADIDAYQDPYWVVSKEKQNYKTGNANYDNHNTETIKARNKFFQEHGLINRLRKNAGVEVKNGKVSRINGKADAADYRQPYWYVSAKDQDYKTGNANYDNSNSQTVKVWKRFVDKHGYINRLRRNAGVEVKNGKVSRINGKADAADYRQPYSNSSGKRKNYRTGNSNYDNPNNKTVQKQQNVRKRISNYFKPQKILNRIRKRKFWPFPFKFADGGFVKGTTLSYVGEDGPEAIIPLGAKRRQRGLDLWNQAGAMLGVPGYANGAIVGANPGETVKKPKKNAVHKAGGNGKTSSGNKKSGVKVSVGNISINVKGSGDGGGKNVNLLQLLRAQKGQVSDELCSIIADAVEGAYKNIPVA